MAPSGKTKAVLRRQFDDIAFATKRDAVGMQTDEYPYSSDKITPLMRAATQEDPGELLDLLNSERDGRGTTISSSLFVKDSMGRTALDWARLVNNEMNVIALRKAMLSAINDARVELVANDLDTTERVRTSNREAGRALMEAVKQRRPLDAMAVISQNKELDRELIEEYNENLQAKYDEEMVAFEDFKAQKMALHVQQGGFEQDRLDYGPEPPKPKIEPFFINTEDHAGFSVLMIAASWDMIDVVTTLLDLGCKVEHKNRYGHTAFTWACTVGHAEVVKSLLFHGANIHHKTLEGRSGLHYACLYLKARVVSCLLDYLFEKFSNYRVQHAKADFDASRWTRYATMLENFLDLQDNKSRRAWELLPIPPPGHLVFDGAAALAKEETARRERKRLRRQTKHLSAQLLAKGVEVTPQNLAAQSAENATNGDGANGSRSVDSESDDDSYDSQKDGTAAHADDSDEEDRREQAEAKANDPEQQAILAELERVAAVVEGREGARPVVTPPEPHMGALSLQEKEMLEAAKKTEDAQSVHEGSREELAPAHLSGTTASTTDTTPAANNDATLTEAVVPLHLRHDAASSVDVNQGLLVSPSSLPHMYGHGRGMDNEASNHTLNMGGIDGYDDPGNLFVRSAHGTPKYAGREGKPKTPLNSTVKLVESDEVRPTSRANILEAQQEILRSELYSEGKKRRQIEENEKKVRQLKRSGKEVPHDLKATIAEQKSKLIGSPSSRHDTDGGQRARTPSVKTPQEAFLEEKRMRIKMAGGEEFVYSTDFREPLAFDAAFAPVDGSIDGTDGADERGSLILPTALLQMDVPGGSSLESVSHASGSNNIPGQEIDAKQEDSFQSIALEVMDDPGAAAAIAAAGMHSRPTTAPSIEDGNAWGEAGTAPLTAIQKEELQRQIDHQLHEAALADQKRADEQFSNGNSVPGGSNQDGESTIVALGPMHNYYGGNELPAEGVPASSRQIVDNKGIVGTAGYNDPDGQLAVTQDVLLAGSGGAGGTTGPLGLQLLDGNGNPVPQTLQRDDDSVPTVHPDEAHAVGIHGIRGFPDTKEGHTTSHVVEVHQIGMLFVHARERIEEWRVSAEKEAALMEKVECWLGCGSMETVEGVAAHVRDLCPYRAKECMQCRGIYRFCDLADHMKLDCLKRLVGCSNAYAGCNEMIPFDGVYKHEQLRCKWRKVPCRLNCGGTISLCKRDDHEQYHCNLRELECDQCHAMVHAAKFGVHLRDECVERFVKCSVSCHQLFRQKHLEKHEQEECVQPCKWGCGRIIGPIQRRELHEVVQCPKRPVECANGCGLAGLVAEYVEEHVRYQCPKGEIRCPNDCGMRLTRAELMRHNDSWHGQCPARLVRCPSNLVGWKVIVVKDDANDVPLLRQETEHASAAASAVVSVVSSPRPTQATGGDSLPMKEQSLSSSTGVNNKKRGRDDDSNGSGSVGTQRQSSISGDESLAPLRGGKSQLAAVGGDDSNGDEKAGEAWDTPLCVETGRWDTPESTRSNTQRDPPSSGVKDVDDAHYTASVPGKVAIGTKTTVTTQGSVKASRSRGSTDPQGSKEVSVRGKKAAQEQENIGIILRYHRTQNADVHFGTSGSNRQGGSNSSDALVHHQGEEMTFDEHSVRKLGGVDRVFIKFADRHEWVDYWSETHRIIPLRKVQGKAETEGHRHNFFQCGWIRYSAFDSHLNFDCINRQVWLPGAQDENLVGGDGFSAPLPNLQIEDAGQTTSTTVALADGTAASSRHGHAPGEHSQSLTHVYRGQASTFKDSVQAAQNRNAIDEFIVKPSDSVRCDYCANQFGFGEIERHQKFDCGKVLVRCKLGCGKKIYREMVEDHASSECTKRPLTCAQCGEEGLWYDEIDNHLENLCPQRSVECALHCGKRDLKAHNEEHHRMFECPNRLVTCTCGKVMTKDLHVDHCIVDCPSKPTLCPQGCGTTIPRDQVAFHVENQCPLKAVFFSGKVFCPIGCGLRLMRRDVLEHVSYYCKRRLSDCPFGCGQCVQFDKLRLHLYFCPKRPVTCEPGAKECTKLFFKWFYCEDSPGDPGGVGFDGDIPGDGANISDELQDIAQLFHSSPRSRPQTRALSSETVGEAGDDLNPDDTHGALVLKNTGQGLKSGWVANENTKGVNPRPVPLGIHSSEKVNNRPASSVQIVENPVAATDVHDDDASALTIFDPRQAQTPGTAGTNGGYITASGRYRHDGDGAGRKTPLPKGASIYFDNHSMYFHGGLRMRKCKRHGTTALMAAVRQSEYPLAEFIIDSCEGQDFELESATGETALTIAARQGKLKFVELLIQGGADINHETSSGKTALIEAVRASQENIPLIEFLVKSGGLVAYKTQKHNRTAIDWARLLVLPASLRILELGRVVQSQTDELFRAIGSGDQEEVERLVGQGDFFEPNNEGKLFEKMENEIEITRKAHLDVKELKRNLSGMTDEVENSKVALNQAQQELDEATLECEAVFHRRDALNLRISRLFVSYERIADTLLPSDLEEVGRMRRPNLPVRAAVFAFGIMLGELDYVQDYPHNDVLDMHSAHKWWPKLAYLLSKSDQTIRKIRSFSLAKLMSDIQAPFLKRARSLYAVLRAAILEEEGLADTLSASDSAANGGAARNARAFPSAQRGALEDAPSSKTRKADSGASLRTQHGGASGKIKKSTVLPDFMAEERRQSRKERKVRKLKAEADALAASVKVDGRPNTLPPAALLSKRKGVSDGNGVDEDDEDDDEDDDDDEGGADSTQPLSIKSWGAKRRVLEHMRESGKLALPDKLGIKEPWYIESQKKAAQAAEEAARKAEEDTAVVGGDGAGGDALAPATSAKMVGDRPSESGKRRTFIPDVDWDSEADEAGGGEWGPDGEWRPVIKKKSQWWNHPEERGGGNGEGKEASASEAGAEDKTSPQGGAIVAETAPRNTPNEGEQETKAASTPSSPTDGGLNQKVSGHRDPPDVGLDDPAYNATLRNNASSHFVRSILVLLKAADQLAMERSTIESMKLEIVDAGQKQENARVVHQAAHVRHAGAVSKRLTTEKILTDMMKYARFTLNRAKEYREKLRIFRLLDKVTLSGHTAVSWAASLGNIEALDCLLSHGATVGYTTQLLHLSATFIQQSFRLYRFITEARRATKEDEEKARKKKEMQKKAASAWKPEGADSDSDTASEADAPANNANTDDMDSGVTDMAVGNTGEFAAVTSTYVIEQMARLKRARGHILHKIRYFRQKMRFPVPEAAYRGNWQIIHRIYERRLFHFNFSHSWIFPSPPPPFLRIHKRFIAKPRKLDMHELMAQGMNDLASGEYVAGVGWVGPNDPREHFGECFEKLTEMWKRIMKDHADVHAERLKLRRLTNERLKQEAAVPLMMEAIRNREYRRCVYFSTECGVSIDMETPQGGTVLIAAAEEDTGVPFYAPMLNDDGRPCLAVEYLLDRTDYRPSVNLEMVASGHNALIRACSLGRASVVESLCDRGADVNYVNKFGRTPLHYAATVGSFVCCRILLERGADVHAQTPEGETAYSIADEYGFLPIMTQMGRHAAGFLGPVRPHRGRVDEFVRCSRGCGASYMKEDERLHEAECVNRIVDCPLKCGIRLLMFKEVDHHCKEECVRRIVPCVHCGEKAEERLQEKHFNTTCRYRKVPCVLGCGRDVQVIEMKKHLELCTFREIRCTLGCGAMIRVKDMIEHDKNVCDMRKISCPLDCGTKVSTRLAMHHQHNVCPNRVVACKWCNEKMKFRFVEAHERSCSVRQEPCPSKCGELVQIGEPTQIHLKETCALRFVPCPEKCGQKVRWADIGGHLEHLCGHRLVPCPLKCVEDYNVPILERKVCQIRASMLEVHTGFECPHRPVQCVQCKKMIPSRELSRHKKVLCEMREVVCRNAGCSKVISLGTREDHERKLCKFRPLSCPLGCGMDVPWIQHGKHTQRFCSMRRVECPLKCGASGIRFHQLQLHIDEDCPRRTLGVTTAGSRATSRGGTRSISDGEAATGGTGRPSSRSSKKEEVAIGTKVFSPVKPS